ncbi:hypothetical protein N8814_05295 [Acidimicrobiia bacterium]|nr:hypothetical protein [Acidimicrobiia bacterium]
MSEYGYIPEAPEQSAFNNKGIFKPKDIYNLDQTNKWTPQLGQLELIETQTASSASADIYTVNFESIQESQYNVHFLTFSEGKSNGYQYLSLRFGNGGTYTTTGYQYAAQEYLDTGSFSEKRSTSDNMLRIGSYVYRGENAYAYIYNIGDSAKYTFTTSMQSAVRDNNLGFRGQFGSGVLRTASSFNNIQILRTNSVGWYSFKASLYGIKEYS